MARLRSSSKAAPPSTSFINVGLFLVLYVVLTTSLPVYLHIQQHDKFNALQCCLSFFIGLNTLICLWEISLGLFISHIKNDSALLKKEYGDNRMGAVMTFFYTPLSISSLFSPKFWTKVWSTYSLYDPSYSNSESFGFFVDVSNGWMTIVPSLLYLYTMTYDFEYLSARTLGCIGLVKFYVEFHGTCVYFLSFFFNERYRNKTIAEVVLFVGVSNGLWFFFPLMGMYASFAMIHADSFAIFGR